MNIYNPSPKQVSARKMATKNQDLSDEDSSCNEEELSDDEVNKETCKTTRSPRLPPYENVKPDISERNQNPVPNYEDTFVHFENKTEKKSESISPKKTFHLFCIILLVLILTTIVGCYGLVGKLMSDIQHEKEVQEQALNLSQAETMNYIKQLQQFNVELKQTIRNLETQLNQNSDKIIKINQSSFLGYTLSDDNWIIPFNGYQYKLIKESLNWNSARSYCQSYGGDLASLGFQSLHIRKVIREAIQYTGLVWIGLNDISSEVTWRWLSSTGSYNGDYATNDISLWRRLSPMNYSSSRNCAVMYFSSAYAYPIYCSYGYYFLCENQM